MKTRTRAQEEMMARTSALSAIENATDFVSVIDVCSRSGLARKCALKAIAQLEAMGVIASLGGRFYARSPRAI